MADDRIQRPNLPYTTPQYDEQNEAAFRREMMTLYAEVDSALLRLQNTLTESVPAHAASHAAGGSDAVTITEAQISDLQAYLTQAAADVLYAALSHNHAASEVTSGTFVDARIAESNVTQHQAALSITESQISDLTHTVATLGAIGNVTITAIASGELLKWNGSAWINQTLAEAGISATGHTHAAGEIVSGSFADARISESSVTQHEAALSILEAQISDLGTYLTAATVASITEDWTWNNNAVYFEVEFSTSIAFGINYGADTAYRLWVAGDGDMLWSDGSAAADAGLRRSAVNTMEFDNNLVVTGTFKFGGGVTINDSTDISQVGHSHVESDITDLGSYVASNVAETITGGWTFTDRVTLDGDSTGETEIVFSQINLSSERYVGCRWYDGGTSKDLARTGIAITTGDLFFQTRTSGGTWNKHLTFLRDGTEMTAHQNLRILNATLNLEGDFTSSITATTKVDTDASARWDINSLGTMRWLSGSGTTYATLASTTDGIKLLDKFYIGEPTGGTQAVRLEIHNSDATIGDPLILRNNSTTAFNVIAFYLQTTRQGIVGFDTTDNLLITSEIASTDIKITQYNNSTSSLILGSASGKLSFFNGGAGAVKATSTGTLANLITILKNYNLIA